MNDWFVRYAYGISIILLGLAMIVHVGAALLPLKGPSWWPRSTWHEIGEATPEQGDTVHDESDGAHATNKGLPPHFWRGATFVMLGVAMIHIGARILAWLWL